jgi:hypothetical protein
MHNFKNFLIENNLGIKQVPFTGKWEIVLFLGEYSPIIKDEYQRITQFIEEVVRNDESFDKNAEIGLVAHQKEEIKDPFKNKYELSFEDRQFLSAKIFGLKLFPVNVESLAWIEVNKEKDNTYLFGLQKKEEIETQAPEDVIPSYEEAFSELKKNFTNTHILMVIDPKKNLDLIKLDKTIIELKDEGINVGFMVWEHKVYNPENILGFDRIDGQIIKAIALLDYVRPEPQDIKSFVFNFRIGEVIDEIKTLHFKCANENYVDAFDLIFPDIKVYKNEDNAKDNSRFILEMLKSMYLKDEYQPIDDKTNK